MKRMVVGFAFDEYGEEVVLVEKRKPAWQEGRINGIGGHIEPGESPLTAMVREAGEEVPNDRLLGVEWQPFAQLMGPGFEVHCFRAFVPMAQWGDGMPMDGVYLDTEEGLLAISRVDDLPRDVLNNLRWLIPLALDRERDAEVPHSPPLLVGVSYGP